MFCHQYPIRTCDWISEVPENKQNNPEKPKSEEQYVVLPGHPFYGRCVRVVSRRTIRTYTLCVIEDPEHPGFHYHLYDRWLSTVPPPEPVPVSGQESLALPLPVLDKMIQMILIKDRRRRDREDDSSVEGGSGEDLGADPTSKQRETNKTPLLSGTQTGGRGLS
jgi:hypothetical protein